MEEEFVMEIFSTIIVLLVVISIVTLILWIPRFIFIGVSYVFSLIRGVLARRRLRNDQAHARVVRSKTKKPDS